MNTRTDSMNVLRTATVGSLLLLVQKNGHGKRDTLFVKVVSRVTTRGRTGSTTLTLENSTRENGAAFDFAVTDENYDAMGIVAAHRVLDR